MLMPRRRRGQLLAERLEMKINTKAVDDGQSVDAYFRLRLMLLWNGTQRPYLA